MPLSEQKSSCRSMLFTRLAASQQAGAGAEQLYFQAAQDSPAVYRAKLAQLADEARRAELPPAELLRRSELFLPWEMSIMLVGLGLNRSQAVFQRLSLHYDMLQRAWALCRKELLGPLILLVLVALGAAWSKQPEDWPALLAHSLWPPVLLLASLFGIIGLIHRNRRRFDYWFMPPILSWIPAVQSLNTAASLYHYLMNLTLCIQAGLPLQKALNLVAKAEANPVMRDRYQKIALDVQSGLSLSLAFRNSQLLDEVRLPALAGQESSDAGEPVAADSMQARIAEIVKASFEDQLLFLARWLPRGLYLLTPLVWLV